MGDVTVKSLRISETRLRDLAPSDEPEPDAEPPGVLTLTVWLHGEGAKEATHFGRVRIREAVDDTGASLKRDAGHPDWRAADLFAAGGGDEFLPLQPAFFRPDEGGADPPPAVDLHLALPRRGARAIARLKGQFQVRAGGERKEVSVRHLPALVGRPIDDPALAAAGLVVTVADPKSLRREVGPMPEGTALPLEITGDPTAIQAVRVLDARGEEVSQGSLPERAEGKRVEVVMLGRPLDDTMTLKLDPLVGQKTVTVPVELEDIPLP